MNNHQSSVDCVCPFCPPIVIPKGTPIQTPVGLRFNQVELRPVPCHREKCQLWAQLSDCCSIQVIAQSIMAIATKHNKTFKQWAVDIAAAQVRKAG